LHRNSNKLRATMGSFYKVPVLFFSFPLRGPRPTAKSARAGGGSYLALPRRDMDVWRLARRCLGILLAAALAAGAAASPRETRSYRQRGIASWYGPEFQGRRTASGERFDMYAMTAAHRTLPLSTEVEVRNPRNGKTVVVRVNDRGPFRGNRIIDLSYSAARALGLVHSGVGVVEIHALERRKAKVR
jgi:rare lipoprotein A (RlpA)-like double-psi beta-barrel protein